VLNAANEEMVAAFHGGSVSFLGIVDTVAAVVDEWLAGRHAGAGNPGTVEDVEHAEEWARAHARTLAARSS